MLVTLKTSMSLRGSGWRLWGAAAVALAAFGSGRAHAMPCSADSDCPAYFTCEIVGTTACAATPACPPGQSCPATPCRPADIRACRSPACASDGDCPTNMVCYAQTTQQCEAQSASPFVDADADGGESRCTSRSVRSCVPRYVPPCTKAADCGDGFSCEETVALSCGGATSDAGAGSLDAGAGAQCSSMRTGQFRCQLEELACSSATDCPQGFSCDSNPALPECGSAASDSGDDGGAPADAGSACSGMPERVCLPPYYGVDFAQGLASGAHKPLLPRAGGNRYVRRRGSGCGVAAGDPAGAGGTGFELAWLALAVLRLRRRARGR